VMIIPSQSPAAIQTFTISFFERVKLGFLCVLCAISLRSLP
jgi:hypothetical protein